MTAYATEAAPRQASLARNELGLQIYSKILEHKKTIPHISNH